MLRIAAAIAIYNEPAAFLSRLFRSLASSVDAVLVFDGRWEGMPETELEPGHPGVRDLAEASGVRHLTLVSSPLWSSQVEKRNFAMVFAGDRADWILVIDGDEMLQVRGNLHAALETAPPGTVTAMSTIVAMNRPRPLSHLAPMTFRQPRLFRAGVELPGPAHNDYARAGRSVLDLPSVDLADTVTIWHDNQARPDARRAGAKAYRSYRRLHGIEVAR